MNLLILPLFSLFMPCCRGKNTETTPPRGRSTGVFPGSGHNLTSHIKKDLRSGIIQSFIKWLNLVTPGYYGPDYRQPERLKKKGYELLHKGKTAEQKARGLRQVIIAHYYQSLKSTMINGTKHPGLQAFIRHWLWANEDGWDRDAVALLKKEYPRPNNLRIKPGTSDWP